MSSFIINPYALASAGGGSFDPTSIAGLELWLDAADSTTLFDATSGGSLPADGTSVKRVNDKSGNNWHATENTNPPIRKVAFQNGLDAIQTNSGSGQGLINSAFTGLDSVSGFTIFQTVKPIEYSGNKMSFGFQNNSHHFQYYNGNYYVYIVGGDYGNGGTTDDTNQLLVSVFDGSQETSTDRIKLYKNGSPVSLSHSLTHATSTGITGGYCLGGAYNYRGSASISHNFYETIIYNTALGTSDREAVESYLMTKWGI